MGCHRLRRVAASFAATGLVAGCGSTVPLAGEVDNGVSGSLASAPNTSAATSGGSGTEPNLAIHSAPAITAAGASAGDQAAAPQPGTSLPDTGAQYVTAPARAASASSIAIGVAIADDATAANAAIGAAGVTHGDETSEYRAIVKDINAHGGLAGRKVTLVEFHYDITSGATTASVEQAACAYFTQDHPVVAVVNVPITDTGLQCLTSKGVAVLGGSLSYATDQTYTKFPLYVEPLAMDLSRMVRNYAAGMAALDWFPKPPGKIGLLSLDNPRMRYAAGQLQAAMGRYGQRISDSAFVHDPQSEGEVSEEGADISSAVLKFRTDGITNVMFMDPSGVSWLLFMQDAESQHYRPRYGFGQSGAAAIRSTGVAAAQFVNSVGVGWMPRLDGVPANQQHYPRAEKPCLALFARNGIAFDSDDARRHADDICDTFTVLRDALASVPGRASADAIVNSVLGLRAIALAASYRLSLAGGRHDGIDLVRYTAYNEKCDCWHYLGGLRQAQ